MISQRVDFSSITHGLETSKINPNTNRNLSFNFQSRPSLNRISGNHTLRNEDSVNTDFSYQKYKTPQNRE